LKNLKIKTVIDLTQGQWIPFYITVIVLTTAIFIRYLLMAGLFYYLFNIRYAAKFAPNRIDTRVSKKGQIKSEILYALIASLLFGILGTWILHAWQLGKTAIYHEVSHYHWSWMIGSVLVLLVLHETYYYWLHRWMHLPSVYRRFHRAHHESLVTTAWTSFSFHPIESLLQALPIVLMIYFIPMHLISLVVFLIIMTVTSVINHLNSEIYPAGTHRHWFGRWWIGATHHALHHSQFKYNFGLYFTFWDHWMCTESPDFNTLFEEKSKHDH